MLNPPASCDTSTAARPLITIRSLLEAAFRLLTNVIAQLLRQGARRCCLRVFPDSGRLRSGWNRRGDPAVTQQQFPLPIRPSARPRCSLDTLSCIKVRYSVSTATVQALTTASTGISPRT